MHIFTVQCSHLWEFDRLTADDLGWFALQDEDTKRIVAVSDDESVLIKALDFLTAQRGE